MLKEIYTAAMGMLTQQTRLEVIANNMANASTIGFKRESVFERNLIDARANFYNVPGDVERNDPPVGSYTDFSAGAFTKTGNPLDVAIDGNGLFTIQDDEGKIYYTRSGKFKLSTDGTIITMDGKILMGLSGPLNVQAEYLSEPMITGETRSVDIRISESGEVFANDYDIGSLMIAKINNPETLQRVSNANFIPTEDSDIEYILLEEIAVKQGWLENSNVDIIREMVAMIELQRMFEAGSKVIKTNESTLDDSIRMGRYY